ncbi:MAG: SDR family oxidoreductase [Dehalococcoidia bacterium]|nr:MAG: SDR family oxidoreductase [Dehalococcoidia bacterium]
MAKDKELDEKVAIVTGGASGIGRAIVLSLAKEGADVTIADIDMDSAQSVAAEVESLGQRALAVKTDVSSSVDVERLVEETVRHFGRIDILVNDAGIGEGGMVEELPEETWDRVLNTNLKGTFLCSKAVLRHMVERKSGRIVNIASGVWFKPVFMSAAYGASKGGVVSFSKALALEVAGHGINVNVVVPGFVDTPMTRRVFPTDEEFQAFAMSPALAPPRGQVAMPDDVADVVLFLVKPESRHIIGQSVHVNGGSTMW